MKFLAIWCPVDSVPNHPDRFREGLETHGAGIEEQGSLKGDGHRATHPWREPFSTSIRMIAKISSSESNARQQSEHKGAVPGMRIPRPPGFPLAKQQSACGLGRGLERLAFVNAAATISTAACAGDGWSGLDLRRHWRREIRWKMDAFFPL